MKYDVLVNLYNEKEKYVFFFVCSANCKKMLTVVL